MKIIRTAMRAASLCVKIRWRSAARSHAKTRVDERRAAFYREIWREAAAGVGHLLVLSPPLLEIRFADTTVRVKGNVTSLDDPVTVAVAEDRLLVYRLLAEQGIPVPRHRAVPADDPWEAWQFVKAAGCPCVVKPAKGSAGGVGVTTGVRSMLSLTRALVDAGAFCGELVVEEQIEGDVYRLLYLDGELVDAVLRRPPTVSGDGCSTVRQLIAAENERRQRVGIAASQSLIRVDGDLAQTLRAKGLTLRSVPAAGTIVLVKSVINDNRREENEPAVDRLCSAVIETGRRAASAVGCRLAGVDVITPEPGIALDESGGVVVEVNANPGYYYHYMNAGEGVPVASVILQRLASVGQ